MIDTVEIIASVWLIILAIVVAGMLIVGVATMWRDRRIQRQRQADADYGDWPE